MWNSKMKQKHTTKWFNNRNDQFRAQRILVPVNTKIAPIKPVPIILIPNAPVCHIMPREDHIQRTKDLKEAMKPFNVFEDESDLKLRVTILDLLSALFKDWIVDVSLAHYMPLDAALKLGGKIQPFGSYRMGIHQRGADIDALLIGPRNISRELFFGSFFNLLKVQEHVTNCRTIEEAYVPVIKLNFYNIEVDLLYARMALKEIPEDLDLKDDMLLKNLDQRCVRSLNGCRVTDKIIQMVPNLENFQLAIRCIKLWAKKQGVYSNMFGYFGGVTWTMLLARVCQMYPNAVGATLVQKFFLEIAFWSWPDAVQLHQEGQTSYLGFPVWDPKGNIVDAKHLMPVITPAYPQQNSTHNVSNATKKIIKKEMIKGFQIVNEIMLEDKPWETLFEPSMNFFKQYRHYIMVVSKAGNAYDHKQWTGLIESRIRHLVANVDQQEFITTVHVNPERFEKSGEFHTNWFIGLEFSQVSNLNVDLTRSIQTFVNVIYKISQNIYKDNMIVNVQYLKRNQLSQHIDACHLAQEHKAHKEPEITVQESTTVSTKSRKRLASVSTNNSSESSESSETEGVRHRSKRAKKFYRHSPNNRNF